MKETLIPVFTSKMANDMAGTPVEECMDGGCPTIYRTSDGRFIIQGRKVELDRYDVSIPSGESVVEVSADFLNLFKESKK